MGEYEKAAHSIETSLAVIEKLGNREEEAATALTNLGVIYRNLKDEKKAEESVGKALEKFKKCASGSYHLAAANNTMAALLFRKGDFCRAKEYFISALGVLKATLGENEEYAICCGSLALTCLKLGEKKEGEDFAKQAAEIYERLYGAEHEKTQNAKRMLKGMNDIL